MIDKLLALLSIACLIGFIGILVFFVGEPDLAIVCTLVVLMALYDFFLHNRSKNKTPKA
jgi:hypothetical protein